MLLVPQGAAAASNVILLWFRVLVFHSCLLLFSILHLIRPIYVLLVLGGERLVGAFGFFFCSVLFSYCLSHKYQVFRCK